MESAQLLLLIYSCLLVRSESFVEEPINGVSLDISSENSQNVAIEKDTLYGIAYKSFLLGGNHYFSRVSEAGVAVWTNEKSTNGRGRCTAVNVFKREGHSPLLTLYNNGLGLSCFVKDGDQWKGIGVEEFDLKYTGMRAGSRTLEYSPALDISNPNPYFVDTYENFAKSIQKTVLDMIKNGSSSTPPFTLDVLDPDPTKVFFVDAGYADLVNWKFAAYVNNTIAKVVNGSETFWEAGSGKKGTLVDLLYKGGEPKFLSVVPDQNDESTGLFFERKNNKWVSVEMNYYYKQFDEYYRDVTYLKSMFPKEGLFVEVRDGQEPIWNGFGEEKCSMAFYRQMNGRATLILQVAKRGYGAELLYFRNDGPGWVSIDECLSTMEDEWVSTTEDKRASINGDKRTSTDWHKFNNLSQSLPKIEQRRQNVSCTLNLANINSNDIFVNEQVHRNVRDSIYFPRAGKYITLVTDKSHFIWTAQSRKRCSFVREITKDGKYILLAVYVENGNRSGFTYFEKGRHGWKSISHSDFSSKVQAMITS